MIGTLSWIAQGLVCLVLYPINPSRMGPWLGRRFPGV